MGFETQEEAERWAENMEFRAEQRREERMLASAPENTRETLDSIIKSLEGGIVKPRAAVNAAYALGAFDGGLKMARAGQRMVENAMNPNGGSKSPSIQLFERVT